MFFSGKYNFFLKINFKTLIKDLSPIQKNNIQKCIEENTERLDLLEKSLAVELRQKKRLLDICVEKQRGEEESERQKLYEGNSSTASLLDQEDAQRKELFDAMVQKTTLSIEPVVKVLSNVQGISN